MEAAKKASKPTMDMSVSLSAAQSAAENECGMKSGLLPGACASLAFPYIPMQENKPARYAQDDAMRAGTLFPGLNLPFHKEIQARFPAENNAMSELMALDFAIQEMGLYLATHKDDREAYELYRSYVRLGKQGRQKYIEQYGPLCQTDIQSDSYQWLNDPWPWDMGGNN